MKKQMIFTFAVISLFAIMTVISAAGEICSITDRNACLNAGDFIIMGLSSTTNAHGELASEGNYNTVLCCNFGDGNLACNGNNKITGLSSQTNADAEIPSLNNYPIEICYDDLSCISTTNSCNTGEIGMFSLTDTTNAHIGQIGDYNINICCILPDDSAGGSGSISPEISDGDNDDSKENDNIKQIKNIDENFISINFIDSAGKFESTVTSDEVQELNSGKITGASIGSGNIIGTMLLFFLILLIIIFLIIIIAVGKKEE